MEIKNSNRLIIWIPVAIIVTYLAIAVINHGIARYWVNEMTEGFESIEHDFANSSNLIRENTELKIANRKLVQNLNEVRADLNEYKVKERTVFGSNGQAVRIEENGRVRYEAN